MRFEARLREGIERGTIVLAFRRWRRHQVDVSEAGYGTIDELLADLHGDPGLPIYRVRLHRVDEPDPRATLAAEPTLSQDDLTVLGARLARMDRSAAHGPWTGAVLAQIADHPGTVSTVLAEALGWERQDFKSHVRRLKVLGLTISLTVGYELSPRGAAYLRHLRGTGGQDGPGAASSSA